MTTELNWIKIESLPIDNLTKEQLLHDPRRVKIACAQTMTELQEGWAEVLKQADGTEENSSVVAQSWDWVESLFSLQYDRVRTIMTFAHTSLD